MTLNQSQMTIFDCLEVNEDQYNCSPQNRERIFIVASLRGSSRPKIFPFGTDGKQINELQGQQVITNCLKARYEATGDGSYVVESEQHAQARGSLKEPVAVIDPGRPQKTMNGRRFKDPGEPMFTLTAQDRHGVAVPYERIAGWVERDDKIFAYRNDAKRSTVQEHVYIKPEGTADALTVGHTPKTVDLQYRIRKLTPLECFRLQSYLDEWYYKLKAAGISDSQLYKMAGNGVTSEVARQIGLRLAAGHLSTESA